MNNTVTDWLTEALSLDLTGSQLHFQSFAACNCKPRQDISILFVLGCGVTMARVSWRMPKYAYLVLTRWGVKFLKTWSCPVLVHTRLLMIRRLHRRTLVTSKSVPRSYLVCLCFFPRENFLESCLQMWGYYGIMILSRGLLHHHSCCYVVYWRLHRMKVLEKVKHSWSTEKVSCSCL